MGKGKSIVLVLQPLSMEPYRMLLAKRETRIYLDKPVPDEVVLKILEAGRLAGSAKNRQPWEFILIREKERLEKLSRYGHYASHLSNASFAVVVTIPDIYVQDKFDAGRAAQNMMLAAHFLGVGSCPITLHDEDGARDFLKIPRERRISVCIAFGYNAEKRRSGRVVRKTLEKILHLEEYGRYYNGGF